ncbi:uncharacterized protein LOC124163441 isoform X2 [Ischnura elegans]|uniref:uncharacterized protein LOC124163441 isoform X2 n=1 Tax=Ischnura elegans TaxID=197161 RepID=UPI001ED8883C|nr:uncharacterized protein LOC124163441 isoform X2 [Ischnura elegans]
MADRFLRVASFAAAAVVYQTEKKIRRPISERKKCGECYKEKLKKSKIESAIAEAREKIARLKNEVGAPAIIVGVSVDGEVLWKEGLGFSDVENQVPAHEDTVMRIASISKCLTAAVVGRLWQEGKIDLDQPIQKYIPNYPEKYFGDYYYTITTRQLMSHLSGIRHYSKMKKSDSMSSGDGQLEEFYGREKYETVEKSLSIFKDDDLLHPPGSKYLYTTYGWTVVSAVMEGATGKTYAQLMRAFFRDMGMRRTYLDEHEPILYGRSRYYGKSKSGKIINSPYVDNSCKWAGGGLQSTVGDLLKFANAMLYAYQFGDAKDVSKASQVVKVIKGKKKKKGLFPPKVAQEQEITKVDEAQEITKVDEEQENIVKKSEETVKSVPEQPKHSKVASAPVDSSISEIDIIRGAGRVAGMVVVGVAKFVGGAGGYVWDSIRRKPQKQNELPEEHNDKLSKVDSMKGVVSQGESSEGEDENRVSKVDRLKEAVWQTGSTVKNVGEGVASAGSYIWDSIWSMTGKQERESSEGEDENKVSKVDRLKEAVSQTGTAVKNVGEGVASAGSYVWDSIWSMTGKQEGESSEGEDENKVSKVDRLKGAVSQTGTAVKNVGEGVASAGSYIWDSIWSMTGKQEGESSEGEDENRVSKVDRLKEAVSQTGTVVKNVGEGVASAGSYVWDSIWSMTGKQEGESSEGEDENKVSKVDRLKGAVSQTGTAVKNVGEGVASAGSYIWDSIWSMTGKQEGESSEGEDENRVSKVDKLKEVGTQAGTAVKSMGQGVFSAGSYLWGKFSSDHQSEKGNVDSKWQSESNGKKNTGKEDSENKQESGWWGSLKNIFNPKAVHSLATKDSNSIDPSSHSFLSSSESILQGILQKEIIPFAVSVVFGMDDDEVNTCHHGFPELDDSNELYNSSGKLRNQLKKSHMSLSSPYVAQETIATLWTRVERTKFSDWGPHVEGGYGLGFGVAPAVDCPGGVVDGGQPFMIGHTGGAVGASSAFIIMPREQCGNDPPNGVAVVLLANMQSVGLNQLAIDIARIFAKATE